MTGNLDYRTYRLQTRLCVDVALVSMLHTLAEVHELHVAHVVRVGPIFLHLTAHKRYVGSHDGVTEKEGPVPARRVLCEVRVAGDPAAPAISTDIY